MNYAGNAATNVLTKQLIVSLCLGAGQVLTTSLKETREIITEHYIDTSRNYQNHTGEKSNPPLT